MLYRREGIVLSRGSCALQASEHNRAERSTERGIREVDFSPEGKEETIRCRHTLRPYAVSTAFSDGRAFDRTPGERLRPCGLPAARGSPLGRRCAASGEGAFNVEGSGAG